MNKGVYHTDVNIICHNKNFMKMKYKHYGLWNIQDIIFIIIIMYWSVKKKSVFEKYFSNTPKYANQIQIQIFHLVGFQIQIQIQIQKFAYLNTNTNTYLTPALVNIAYIGSGNDKTIIIKFVLCHSPEPYVTWIACQFNL